MSKSAVLAGAPAASRAMMGAALLWAAALAGAPGCAPARYREDADRAAYAIVGEGQRRALGRSEPFSITPAADALRRKLLLEQGLPYVGRASLGSEHLPPPPHWPEAVVPAATAPDPDPAAADRPLRLTLNEALGVAARHNRTYQTAKESVFAAALRLDLEANQFRTLLAADAASQYVADLGAAPDMHGLANSAATTAQRRLKSGAVVTAGFAIDLAKLLTQDRASALGLLADATISIPLLRGAGAHIVAEPLTQAERDVAYALWRLERQKRVLAVQVAGGYLAVLQQLDQIRNARENYRRLIVASRRARRLADAGRLPQIQVDQATQDELRARERWVSAQQSLQGGLDQLKLTLGLPTDARLELDAGELQRMADQAQAMRRDTGAPATQPAGGAGLAPPATGLGVDAPVVLEPARPGTGRMEMEEPAALRIALERRLDLREALAQVEDAQRGVVVAADALRMGLTLAGDGAIGGRRGSIGSASSGDAKLRFDQGTYSLALLADFPLERTAERNAYRNSLVALEQAVRDAQRTEDEVKQQVRDALRRLLQARETYRIQAQAVAVAQRRVSSTELFLEAGRAEIRDVLEAQESLVNAQNAQTAALVNYRLAELQLQRDMDVLRIDEKGAWIEYQP